ncbi:hypothetical protein PG996_006536 [Apiospora saccharicola]|uniref:C2H2-type domain-containing protein n=1 Tax=Apiospora saccharicola TaxID=335842 RepID=A0ABR1V891_9PEZI
MSELQRAQPPPDCGDSLPENPIESAATKGQAELHHSYNFWRALFLASLCCVCCPKVIKLDTDVYFNQLLLGTFQWMIDEDVQEDDGSSGTGTGSGSGSSSGTGSGGTGGTRPTSLGGTTYAPGSGTRIIQRGGDKEPDPDPERQGDKSHRGTSTVSTRPNGRQFLCPFFFQGRLGIACDCKFNRIGDVRQHLYRKHRQPIHCPICGHTFLTEQDSAAHITQDSCTEVAFNLAGVTRDQWGAICECAQAAPHTINGRDVERWFAIWEILFPGEPRPPSPFVDVSIFMMRFRDDLQRFFGQGRGWDVILEQIPLETPHIHPGYRQGLHNVFNVLAERLIAFVEEEEERPEEVNRAPP